MRILSALALVLLASDVLAEVETLLRIEPTDQQPRNSEGDIIRLRDGRLCLIYSRFRGPRPQPERPGGGIRDHSPADLAMRTSSDGGRTWSADRIVVENDAGSNIMSASLLRLKTGAIALFYLYKESLTNCRPVMRISNDEAASWSQVTYCTAEEIGYFILNNDRAVELSGGRIVLPLALHNTPEYEKPDWQGTILCYLSDDSGKTWRSSRDRFKAFSPEGERVTAQEPGVVELKDGRLLMFVRTDAGSQYLSYSSDQGDTWTKPTPSDLASPVSPTTIERVPWSGDLLCVWNDHSGRHPFRRGRRSPLTVAISRDDGRTWEPSRAIERNYRGWYCYTSMSFLDDRVLLSYCAGSRRIGRLHRLKVVSISRQALDGKGELVPLPASLLPECLDYGRSFIGSSASFNSPRFWVESRLVLSDPASGKTLEYLQAGSCKSEQTFASRDLFMEDNYDFLPIFSPTESIIFRRHAKLTPRYRDVRAHAEGWGPTRPQLRKFKGRVLQSPDEIVAAMDAGKPIVAQTEIRDEKTGRTAVLEYPVKTINWHPKHKDWQIDTGPVPFPDLSVPPGNWSETIRLAYVAFSAPDWADFVIEEPVAIDERKDVPKVVHYSKIEHRKTRNRLLALDE